MARRTDSSGLTLVSNPARCPLAKSGDMKILEWREITRFLVGINCGKRRAEILNSARLSERVPELRTAGMVGSRANQTRQPAYYLHAPPALSILFLPYSDACNAVTVYRSIRVEPAYLIVYLHFRRCQGYMTAQTACPCALQAPRRSTS